MGDSRSQTGSLMLSSQVCVYHRRGQTGVHLLRRKPGLLPWGVEAVWDALQEREDSDERQRSGEGLLCLLRDDAGTCQRAGDGLRKHGPAEVVEPARPMGRARGIAGPCNHPVLGISVVAVAGQISKKVNINR